MNRKVMFLGLVVLAAGVVRADIPEGRNKAEIRPVKDPYVLAVQTVMKLGGSAGRLDSAPGKPVDAVDLNRTKVADTDLHDLAALRHLRWLGLNDTQVGDAGLKELASFTQLQALAVRNTRVTDAGLKYLAVLVRLEQLDLHGTQVSDAGLEPLTALKQLEFLDIRKTKITDMAVQELRQALPRCRIDH